MKSMTLIALTASVALALAACVGGGEPQEHTFNINLEGGALAGSDSTWRVNQDDRVTLIVRSDRPVSFHLHGYDFEEEVEPGNPATFIFTANATGSFPITIHRAAPGMAMDGMAMDDHAMEHSQAVEAPEGMSVSVTAEPDTVSGINVHISTTNFTFAGQEAGSDHVPGQGHAHLYVDGVKVGRPYGPDYHVSAVEPGERIVRVILNTNAHSEYAVGGHVVEATTTVVVPGVASSGGHGHDEDAGDGETVEAELGRFEVRP